MVRRSEDEATSWGGVYGLSQIVLQFFRTGESSKILAWFWDSLRDDGIPHVSFFWFEPESVYWNAVGGLWVLLWTVASFAVAAKRLHDLDVSGWWILGFMIMVFLFNAGFAASFVQFRGV